MKSYRAGAVRTLLVYLAFNNPAVLGLNVQNNIRKQRALAFGWNIHDKRALCRVQAENDQMNDVELANYRIKFRSLQTEQQAAQKLKKPQRALMKGSTAKLFDSISSVRPSPDFNLKEKAQETLKNERDDIIFETVFISLIGMCLCWGFGNMATAFSFGVGSAIGIG